jgi:hypothetical protein
MDQLVTTAIVGTGQQSQPDLTTGTPVDVLLSQLASEELEHKLLLAAGVSTAYRAAGKQVQSGKPAVTIAPDEQLPVCSANVSAMLEQYWSGSQQKLIPEVLTLLRKARQRLPHSILPLALTYGRQNKEQQADLLPALGERGRWLSQFNQDWSWVTHFLTEQSEDLPDNAESIWQEGPLGQRTEILRRLRAVDPGKVREWLTEVWKQEPAQNKEQFLGALEINLSAEDETLLEQALDDRGKTVPQAAMKLLARIPGSAFSQRMFARADAILSFQKKAGKHKAHFVFTLPESVTQEWRRDGIALKKPEDLTLSLFQGLILPYIPPSHWEERFSATSSELIKAAEANEGEFKALLPGWLQATQLFHSMTWGGPLFDWWYKEHKGQYYFSVDDMHLCSELLHSLPETEREAKLLPLLERGENRLYATSALFTLLPRPWSKKFSHYCLQFFKKFVEESQKRSSDVYGWGQVAEQLSIAMPAESFELVGTWETSEKTPDQVLTIINSFAETIQMRKMFTEEIH